MSKRREREDLQHRRRVIDEDFAKSERGKKKEKEKKGIPATEEKGRRRLETEDRDGSDE